MQRMEPPKKDAEYNKLISELKFIKNYGSIFDSSKIYAQQAIDTLNVWREKIKELENMQTARIMTLEEIDGILSGSMESHNTIFWAESRSKTTCSFGVFQLDYSDDGDFEALLIGCSWPSHYRRETYGITWRVWTTKPTDEQRKAVPWNERSSI